MHKYVGGVEEDEEVGKRQWKLTIADAEDEVVVQAPGRSLLERVLPWTGNQASHWSRL